MWNGKFWCPPLRNKMISLLLLKDALCKLSTSWSNLSLTCTSKKRSNTCPFYATHHIRPTSIHDLFCGSYFICQMAVALELYHWYQDPLMVPFWVFSTKMFHPSILCIWSLSGLYIRIIYARAFLLSSYYWPFKLGVAEIRNGCCWGVCVCMSVEPYDLHIISPVWTETCARVGRKYKQKRLFLEGLGRWATRIVQNPYLCQKWKEGRNHSIILIWETMNFKNKSQWWPRMVEARIESSHVLLVGLLQLGRVRWKHKASRHEVGSRCDGYSLEGLVYSIGSI